LAFLAQDADTRVFCYANGELRKDQQNDEILRFVDFWEKRTGRLPEELIFDSKLTTYANLNELNRMGVLFITLRRRTPKLLAEIARTAPSAWRRVELESVSRAYRTPRVLDRRVTLKGYDGPLRQLTIAELGHEEPTLLLTNQLSRSPSHLIGRYAQRMLIREQHRGRGRFFPHGRAVFGGGDEGQLRPATDADGQQSVPVVGGPASATATSRPSPATCSATSSTPRRGIAIDEAEVVVRYQRRAHNPLLLAAGFDKTDIKVPWLGEGGCGSTSEGRFSAPRPSMV